MLLESNPAFNQNNKKHLLVDMKTVGKDLEELNKRIDELIEKIKVLPKVDSKGGSECPFAESLYAYKEMAARGVKKTVKKVRQYIPAVEKEVERCEHNYKRICDDCEKINNAEAKEKYEHARKFQWAECEKAFMRRKHFYETLDRAKKELEKAKEKKWPLGEPKADDSFDPEAVLEEVIKGRSPMPHPTNAPASRRRSHFSREINSLLSLGPLGRTGF